ncbi:MAG: hypothetical protein GY946_20990 [bacterium]|nr:hypothetical protein [bacterium]
MAGRKIKDEPEAIAVLDSIARIGLELSEWCRARDIDPRSLGGRRSVLEARGFESPEHPSFVEVVRVPVERTALVHGSGPGHVFLLTTRRRPGLNPSV